MNGFTAARDAGARVARWLAETNGTGPLQQVLQVTAKPMEELAELMSAMAAGDLAGAVGECCDLVITVRAAQVTIGQRARPLNAPMARAEGDVVDTLNGLSRAVLDLGGVAIAWTGQNPRKLAANGGTLPDEVVSDHLDIVALLACRLIHALGRDVDDALLEATVRLHHRLDGMEVPR